MRTHDRLARVADWLRRGIDECPHPDLQAELRALLQHANQVREHALARAGQQDLFTNTVAQQERLTNELIVALGRTRNPYQRSSATSTAAALPARGTQRERVLWLLYTYGPMTDEQIARQLGILRSSASARRNNLYEDGMVVPGSAVTNRRGYRATTWALRPDLRSAARAYFGTRKEAV